MTYAIDTSDDLMGFDRGLRRRSVSSHAVFGAVALSFSLCLGAWMLNAPSAVVSQADEAPPPAPAPKAVAAASSYNVLLDPAFSLGFVPASLGRNVPPPSTFASLPTTPAPLPPPPAEPEVILPKPATAAASPLVESVPLPTPRPPELQARAGQGPVRGFGRQTAQRTKPAVVPAAPADNRSFFEKLFGAVAPKPAGTVLAYAAPEDGLVRNAYRTPPAAALPSDRVTAVYDIEAHTVTLPDGTRLEAHSGLGDRLDDPRYVHERMRGPTPPHVYDLQFREQLFHGVRAIRMNPVGGGGVFGRTGLLAHTYMLGPKGDSNGCVSFRDYDAFLRAFESGQVKRLAVVARSG